MPRVCPWWQTYTFDNPLRRLFHDPQKMLARYVRPGMRVADLGCGMGYFTIPLAMLVGPGGMVQAVDLQPQQLKRVERRAKKAGLSELVELITASPSSLNLRGKLDFVLGFWMVHEVPDASRFFAEVHEHLQSRGTMLVAEPSFHVRRKAFDQMVAIAVENGFTARSVDEKVRLSRAVLFEPKGSESNQPRAAA